MKVNIKMTKNTVKVHLNGRMEENMWDHGKMANSMEQVHIFWRMEKK